MQSNTLTNTPAAPNILGYTPPAIKPIYEQQETGSNKTANIPVLSVGMAMWQLTEAFNGIINNKLPVTLLPSVMLWGPPGVGKSQGVRQLAADIEAGTGKTVKVTDARLLLFNPIDLRGIPTANEDKTFAVWLKPAIFKMDESDDVINILFLDEISAAPPSVQAAAYQITLDRTVGEHKLSDNCIVIAAGNRVTDKSVAYKMPKALANRLCHIEIEADFQSWKQWAIRKGINAKVTGFLTFRSDYLMAFDTKRDDPAFTTPRSWEMVSNILNYVSDDIDKCFNLIAGCIGTGMALDFRKWCAVYENMPDIEEIFNGTCIQFPERTDVMYALISSMVNHAIIYKNDFLKIGNSIKYAMKMPKEFSTILLLDYAVIEKDYHKKLLMLPEFSRWLQENERCFKYA